jgi:hypothetical protein
VPEPFGSQYVAQAFISLRRLSSASLRRYAYSALPKAVRTDLDGREVTRVPTAKTLFFALHESGHGPSRRFASEAQPSIAQGDAFDPNADIIGERIET